MYNLIVCLDDLNGYAFNHRRQSRDQMVIEDIVKMTCGFLTISHYSHDLFTKEQLKMMQEKASMPIDEEIYFFFDADGDLATLDTDHIREIIVYRWNRTYPRDKVFPAEFLSNYCLSQKIKFSGKSHKKITKEIYRREN